MVAAMLVATAVVAAIMVVATVVVATVVVSLLRWSLLRWSLLACRLIDQRRLPTAEGHRLLAVPQCPQRESVILSTAPRLLGSRLVSKCGSSVKKGSRYCESLELAYRLTSTSRQLLESPSR